MGYGRATGKPRIRKHFAQVGSNIRQKIARPKYRAKRSNRVRVNVRGNVPNFGFGG